MKTFYRTAIALCLSLAILFLTVGSAAAASVNNSTLEIRGPVYDGHDINDIFNKTGGTISMNATQFAFFFNDNMDQNVTTENVTLK